VLPFCKLIEESSTLPFYMLSHESAEGFTADAAARFHSGPSVAVVTWGAGALNLVDAVAGAYAERVPVVVISGARGAHERASGRHLHHMARALATQIRVFSEITCDQTSLLDPRTTPAEIRVPGRTAKFYTLRPPRLSAAF
jgi:indolepyruvate decarboxylase